MADPVLVLWDLDMTLLDPAGFGHRMIAPVLTSTLGREPVVEVPFAGRTDRAILTDLLHVHGGDLSLLGPFMDAVAERCQARADDLLDGGGGPLPGAHAAVTALAAAGVHQGVVTGNMRRTALLKLRICGFGGAPDPALGGFGDRHLDRADLVRDALSSTRARGLAIAAGRTVIVGDTVHDIRGALDSGARAIGVATGRATTSDLARAGANTVLPDLTDSEALVTAVHHAASSS